MVDNGRHSETTRVLVNYEGLAILSLLKIQSAPLGNFGDSPFDGDEMNLHMPQDPESEAELRYLAAVPYQIVSPANNSSIIGIYQDSMLGCYQFTREKINFTPREAMNILMMFDRVNIKELFKNIEEKNGMISNFDIMSQILPPLSLKYKTKAFDESNDDIKKSNTIVEIRNGEYIRGQMDKSVLGGNTKGILQRICNNFGNMASAKFIDDLQNIITEYMKSSSFSVGVSDLISDNKTNDEIVQVITKKKSEVSNLISQTQIGVFENNTGKTNEEEFETQVNNILSQASSESGKIGLKSLGKNNRFVTMVNSGSKGSDLNISFMISCLGQQNVDGKRIPYGFEHRTLPHFSKYDDSPVARGFVESSYINGLSPQELFFHAMGGRVGLIDTAVKTSSTGYIQRRLIKGLEDLMVNYGMTVRSNKNKIIQFSYGDDNIDSTTVENQSIPLVNMNIQDIYAHFNVPDETGSTKSISNVFLKNVLARYKKQKEIMIEYCNKYTQFMIEMRDELVKSVFKYKDESTVNSPVGFAFIIGNIQGQTNITVNSLVDITPVEAFEMIEKAYSILEKIHYAPPTLLFKILYYYYLSPKELLITKRFNKSSLIILLDTIIADYKRAIVAPGEMVGMLSGQSIGEVSTQMSVPFNSQHKIVIKNKSSGEISLKSIIMGEFCDILIEQNPQLTFNTGHQNSVETLLDTLENEYYIVGVSEDEKTSWNKISHISKHPVNGQMMKVYTKSGRVVESTTSHSHLIRENHKVVPIVGANMKEGMRIPICAHIDNTFVKDTYKSYKLDELFGWFIGAYLAEGNLNYNEISITNISEYYIENTKKIASLFGKECRVIEKQGEFGKSITTKFNCEQLAKLLLTTCGNGSFVKKVPDFAFTAPDEFKKGLFQGYFDGDGNFQCDQNHHQIRCCSRSEQLIKDLALILNYFDICGNIKSEMNKGNMLYHLNISSKYAKQYQMQIGSVLHSDKLNNLVKFIERNDIKFLSEQIDKINGMGEIVAYCGKTLQLPGQSRTYGFWKNKDTIGRRTLEKYYNVFNEHPNKEQIKDELLLIKQAISSNVVWDEIINIEYYTPEQTNFVYDFTVPSNQTFMTDYGVIVHNTLNTFHFAGVASKSNVTRGVPRIEEILSLSDNPKNPSLTIYLKPEDETQKDKAQSIMYMLEHTRMEEIVQSIEICFDPDDLNSLITEDKNTIEQYRAFENTINECAEVNLSSDENEKSKWVIRMVMNPEIMLEKNITMDDVNFTLNNCYENQINCVYSDYNANKLIFRIRMNEVIKSSSSKNGQKNIKANPLDQSDHIYLLKNFQDQLLQNVVLRGIKGIDKVIIRKIKNTLIESNGAYKKQDIWVLDTIGTNMLDILAIDYIDGSRTFSNDITEIYNVLGIEAARLAIYNELVEVIEFDGTYINYHHFSVLCDRMTYSSKMISIFRHGINNDNIGPIAKASFEETPEMFLKAARHAELDTLRGISANVMCGQEGYFGTSAFQVILDIEEMQKLEETSEYIPVDKDDEIEKFFDKVENSKDICSITDLSIQNNVISIKPIDMGIDNSGYNPGF
jgi:DNA-directed RNA polymerase beta' subunit